LIAYEERKRTLDQRIQDHQLRMSEEYSANSLLDDDNVSSDTLAASITEILKVEEEASASVQLERAFDPNVVDVVEAHRTLQSYPANFRSGAADCWRCGAARRRSCATTFATLPLL
jgi:hypothetical protein